MTSTTLPISALADPEGPPGYLIAPDAAVTLIAFRSGKVLYNRAYRPSEWNDAAADAALKDLPGWFGLGSALEAVVAEEGLARARFLYGDWPFFRALVDNARLALTQADLDVAAHYARLAEPDARGIFDLIRAEHERTVRAIREVTGDPALMSPWPALAFSAERRNP